MSSGARNIAGAGSTPQGKAAPTPVNTPLNAAPISQGLSRPTVPDTIEENKSDNDDGSEEDVGSMDPSAQAIYNLVHGRLAGLVGRSSGYVENLPAVVKRRVEGLKGVQAKYTELEAQMKREMLELEKKYLALYTPIFERRRAILSGEAEPTDEEVAAGEAITAEDKGDEEEDELIAAASKLGVSRNKPEPAAKEEANEDVKGVPQFWLTALRNHPELQEKITERDEEALAYLSDVKLSYLADPDLGFKITFVFDENPFFEDKELHKTYYYEKELGYTGEYTYQRGAGTKIKWKEDKDLTKTVEIKKQRNKNTNRTRLVRRTQTVESFFDFFAPPLPISTDAELIEAGLAVDEKALDDEETEEIAEKLESDYQLGEDFKDKIVPRAIDYFTGKALRFEQIYSDLSDDESETSDASSSGDSDDGPRRAPAPKKKGEAEKAEECKNQ